MSNFEITFFFSSIFPTAKKIYLFKVKVFSTKATKVEDFFKFCGYLRIYEVKFKVIW